MKDQNPNLEQQIESAIDREYKDDHLSDAEQSVLVEAYRKENHWLPLPVDVRECYLWILEHEG